MKKQSNDIKYTCRICLSSSFDNTAYPDLRFNKKVFTYNCCKKCKSFNVFPNPSEEDLSLIYGEDDHSYLKNDDEKLTYTYDFPFAHYHKFQIDFLNEIKKDLKGKSLLDFACGSGFYLNYAKSLGADVVGIEFDASFVELLNKKTDLNIFTLEQALTKFENSPFDYIHLGHVLEHLSNPHQIINTLKKISHANTIFVVDGPLEKNPCLSRFYIDFGSRILNREYKEMPPQHLTLTNYKSQLLFFSELGIKPLRYAVVEQYFPLPNKISFSLRKNISYVIATLSIIISKIIPRYGNIFHFRGKIN